MLSPPTLDHGNPEKPAIDFHPVRAHSAKNTVPGRERLHRMRRAILYAALFFVIPLHARAEQIFHFTLTDYGPDFNLDPDSTPERVITFSLPASPVGPLPPTGNPFTDDEGFDVYNVPTEVNGVPELASDIFFGPPVCGCGLFLQFASGTVAAFGGTEGPVLYDLPPDRIPVFTPVDAYIFDVGVPFAIVTAVPGPATTPTPEPSTVALLGTGCLGLLTALRRRP